MAILKGVKRLLVNSKYQLSETKKAGFCPAFLLSGIIYYLFRVTLFVETKFSP